MFQCHAKGHVQFLEHCSLLFSAKWEMTNLSILAHYYIYLSICVYDICSLVAIYSNL